MDLSFVSLALSGASALRGHFINTAHVLSTTSSEAKNYALPWQQCGGKHYKGHTKCTPGHLCKHLNDWWSQCVPDPSLKGPPTYSQCGGKGFEGETTCRDGDMCVVLSKYYSQCVPMVMPPQYKQKCTNVNVLGDATYCIKGPVCGSEDEEGHKCPKKGDIAVGNCLSQLKSYVAFAKCVAPKDATCQKTEFGESICSFSKIHIKTTKATATEAPSTEAPPTSATGDKNSTAIVIDTPAVVNITVRGNETIPVIAVMPLIFGNDTSSNATDDEVVTTSVPPVTMISVNTSATNKTNKTLETITPPSTTIVAVNATSASDDVIIAPTNITAAPVDDVIVAPVANTSLVLNVTAAPTQVVVVSPNATQEPTTETILFPVSAPNGTDAPATTAATTLLVNVTGANATETSDVIVFPTLI
ncbi:hypothetical protein SDRG_03309 [Saprolegnia diclina VS20]|uniref:CBM1 domain-containing protein n=1 Tax=Saprolegnia diclina (strain VS20) TaxID=1156394 RepID=T0QWQ0_SAPDV|nr:hypothetical protein SDRG_03309 [Saprolegnia diclina VS20]EQC39101.1 hypothetical protein SDRG_03309 [Saprolegnia diclina VS20]|eukprot:XP_008607162.1 hypothetical protein SDRG_03309 [Saprolegnia diclina VS20]